MGILDFITDTIGIDPGSQNLRIIRGGELVFNEKSQISIARDGDDWDVSGIGNSIRSTKHDVVIKPVRYCIYDFHAFEMLLRGAIKKAVKRKSFLTNTYVMFFCIPTNTSEVEKRAYRDSGEHANAKEVYMMHQSCCAAVGLNILFEKKDFVIVDIGASKIEMSVFANSLLISTGELRFGTWKLVSIVRNYLRRTSKIEASDDDILDLLAGLVNAKDDLKFQFKIVDAREIKNVVDKFFYLVNDALLETMEHVSGHPDMKKVLKNGVYLTGGGSTYDFLRKGIKLEADIPIHLSKTPFLDSINGLKTAIAKKEKFTDYLMI